MKTIDNNQNEFPAVDAKRKRGRPCLPEELKKKKRRLLVSVPIDMVPQVKAFLKELRKARKIRLQAEREARKPRINPPGVRGRPRKYST